MKMIQYIQRMCDINKKIQHTVKGGKKQMKNEKGTMVLTGGVIGVIAAILVFFGNPANMGFCIA